MQNEDFLITFALIVNFSYKYYKRVTCYEYSNVKVL